jgi:phosphate/sulfate permease
VEDVKVTQKSIAKRVVIANTVVGLAGLLFIKPTMPFIMGLLFGTIVSVLNFRLLSLTIARAVTMHPERARKFTVSRYMIRYVLTALVILVSINSPDINVLGTAIGLITLKLVILQRDLFNHKQYFKNIFSGKEEK